MKKNFIGKIVVAFFNAFDFVIDCVLLPIFVYTPALFFWVILSYSNFNLLELKNNFSLIDYVSAFDIFINYSLASIIVFTFLKFVRILIIKR